MAQNGSRRTELNDAIEELSKLEATLDEGTKISYDPSTVITGLKKEAMEAHEKYVEFKDKHNREMRELKKYRLK